MQSQTLHKLLQDLEQELLRLDYTKGSMTFYRNRWRKLEDFAGSSAESVGKLIAKGALPAFSNIE